MLSADPGPAGLAPGAEGLIDPRRVFHRLPGGSREELLEELAARLAEDGVVSDPGELSARLIDRERLGCTGLGGGVAIPHCKLRHIQGVVVAVASTAVPVDFGAADGIPIDLVFLVASPADAPAAHLQALARVSRLLRTPGVVEG
ncbi:MAG TPA: PTS sugar transporter subunit IIA, partial [Thermoanaerobaculia bacterium]|nr:PTS sugar transporter subunit IIA [Thermoanaerobaculia bacterium]